MGGRVRASAVAGAILASLWLATVAQAETRTVGADFSQPAVFTPTCGFDSSESCGSIIVGASAPATGTRSPVNGTVTGWRIGGASAIAGYSINVVRKDSGGTWTVTASGPSVTPGGVPDQSFASSLPIKAGEYIELNAPLNGKITIFEGSSTEAAFEPSLGPSETRAAKVEGQTPGIVAFAATIDGTSPAPPMIPAPVPIAAPAPDGHCVVPKLAGKKLKAAKKKIRAAGCKVGHVSKKKRAKVGKAKVKKQSRKPGKTLPTGTKVNVTLG